VPILPSPRVPAWRLSRKLRQLRDKPRPFSRGKLTFAQPRLSSCSSFSASGLSMKEIPEPSRLSSIA
jgi:hypothetical protein